MDTPAYRVLTEVIETLESATFNASAKKVRKARDNLDHASLVENITEDETWAADEAREILEHKERRDRFAMAALPGVMRDAPPETGIGVDALANAAYQIADAMIKARDA